MAPLTPQQQRNRERVEGFIRVIAPALDLVLWAGDRLSRIVSSEDTEYPATRAGETSPRTNGRRAG
jgi:hypothetical protein